MHHAWLALLSRSSCSTLYSAYDSYSITRLQHLHKLITLHLPNHSRAVVGHRLFSACDTSSAAAASKASSPSNTSYFNDPTASVQNAAQRDPTAAAVLSAEGSVSSASILQKYISQELVTDVSSTINRLTGYEGIDRWQLTASGASSFPASQCYSVRGVCGCIAREDVLAVCWTNDS
jgi:hypothetical protein